MRQEIRNGEIPAQGKVFCIGLNKTGTTSLSRAFVDLGFAVGYQRMAELLLREYLKDDFSPIISYCHTAQVFQDVPFSFPETYKHLDRAFPDAKFILSVRDSAEQWYTSITRYHALAFGNGEVPTAAQLKESEYVCKGWIWEAMQSAYKAPEDDPYNREILIATYVKYNEEVREYFATRPNKLIVVNLAEPNSYSRLMNFLNVDSPFETFPWENKTADLLLSE